MSDTERLEAAAVKLERRAAVIKPVSIGVGTWVEFQAHGVSFGGYISACHHDEDGTLIIDRFRKTKPEGRAGGRDECGCGGKGSAWCNCNALAAADAVLGVPASPKEQT